MSTISKSQSDLRKAVQIQKLVWIMRHQSDFWEYIQTVLSSSKNDLHPHWYLASIFGCHLLLAIYLSHSGQYVQPAIIISYFSEPGLPILVELVSGNFLQKKFTIRYFSELIFTYIVPIDDIYWFSLRFMVRLKPANPQMTSLSSNISSCLGFQRQMSATFLIFHDHAC